MRIAQSTQQWFPFGAAIVWLAAVAIDGSAISAQQLCQADGPTAALPEIPEASGLAASRRTPGRLWTHGDENPPILFALDSKGRMTARVRVTGAVLEDWEAIAVGACPGGSCIYIGDIGDNAKSRQRISVYRLVEPDATSTRAAVQDVFHATYPDGPHDAETLLATDNGDLFIITKGDVAGLYKFPHDLESGATHPLERIATMRGSKRSRTERITDGSLSPDGVWVVLRTGRRLEFYPSAELLAGHWRGERRVDISALGEPQGEAVAFAAADSVFVAGEGGGNGRPGTFAHLKCDIGR